MNTVKVEEHFGYPANPGATADQWRIEKLALEIAKSQAVEEAKTKVTFMWRSIVGSSPSEKSWDRFEASLQEYVYNYALKAANGDSNYPSVTTTIYVAPHQWMGLDVPGSRLGGDNPDNQYALIPVDDAARFELRGQWVEPRPADINLTLSGNTTLSKTIASIEGRDLEVDEDGSFQITIDTSIADGRKNHLRTKKGVLFLFIRQSRSDWSQKQARLWVRRLDPPSAPPLSFNEKADRAADMIVDDVPWTYWWAALSRALPLNTMGMPFKTVGVGGLHSQQVSFAHVHLQHDEAFIITVRSGGAGFRNLVLHDFWYLSMQVDSFTSCLNSGQAVADEDGRFTYVISHDDPGVENWLNPVDQDQLLIVHRWQVLPRESTGDRPEIFGRLVKRSSLDAELPHGVRRIDPQARKRQMEKRREQFAYRYLNA